MQKNWQSILIDENTPILDAIRVIDEGALRIAIVTQENGVLRGVVTDGDVRRGILKGISVNEPVSTIMNASPITGSINDAKEQLLAKMKEHDLFHLPIVDEHNIIVNLETLQKLISPPKRDNYVILMAGGLGTRLRPLTDECPKPLLKIGEKPILETILSNFIDAGFHKFFISVNYKSQMLKEHFGDGSEWGVSIEYLEEKQRLGTAGALSLLPAKPDLPILVMNGDILTRINFIHMLDFHNRQNSVATMAVRQYQHTIPYGVVHMDEFRLVALEEKPTQDVYVNAGVYVLSPQALEQIPEHTFFDMPDLFEQLIQNEQITAAFPVREYWLDIGRLEDFEQAQIDFGEIFS